MFLLFLLICLVLFYIALLALIPLFFEQPVKNFFKNISPLSIALILVLGFLSFFVSFMIPNYELGNRFLHAVGGGVMGFVVCFLATKDSSISMSKFQFFSFSFLIVTMLGVGNEILEFCVQNLTPFVFASTINDTWLDLISNTTGAFFAGLVLTFFYKKPKKV